MNNVECPQTCFAFQTCEPSIRRNASKHINDGYFNGLLGHAAWRKLGQALGYLGNQWPKPCRYIENEAWPMYNNACENSIRPFVLGSKN